MSDQRPEWMPSNKEIQENNVCPCDDCVAMRYLTGLRAQLHELESLIVGHEGSHMVDRVKARIEEIRKELG